ncbi:hypothetical protein PACTADRAFT_76732 [Pachysolen tannophilus NRRL Y-2460]|uniref:Vps41 beta-propeller domain-containing protein n=1 Tax=Pachysolen tannophilus NRRL Y-2460 TaxID=669874 RepID=A0A1E4TQT5_PACTA|nr:hypothetical protein PACTADRAFT_76732 [Pachysolen tannophilus NRRL Y-2460]
MSISNSSIWAPLPSTTRAFPTHLSYDLKSDRIAYASGKSVFVRSVSDPSKSIQFIQHNAPASVARFAPSGFYIASGDENGNVKIWDCVGEDLILKGEYPIISGKINDIAWDVESKRIIAVGDGKERFGHCFTYDSGNSVGEILGHSSQINAVAIKPNRPYRAATVSDDGGLVFLAGPPFKFQASVRGHHNNFVRDVKYSPDGKYIVSVGFDRKIVVYDGKNGEFLKEIENDHQGGLFGVDFIIGQDNKFVTCSADCSVKLWDIESDKLIKSWNLENKLENQQVGLVSTKDYIISLSLNGNLNYFKIDSDDTKPSKIVKGHQKSITALATTENGEYIYTGSYDGRFCKWSLDTGLAQDIEPGESTLIHSNLIVGINNLKRGNELISVAWDDTIKKITNSKFNGSLNIGEQPRQVASFTDKSVVITETKLILYDNNGSLEKLKEIELKFPTTPALDICSKYIVITNASNNQPIIYDFELNQIESINLPTIVSKPNIAKISPNEKFLAVGDIFGKIFLFNLETQKIQTSRWSFHTSKINSIAWNEDNDHVVSGSSDTNIIVYSVTSPGRTIKSLNAHKEGVNAVSWIYRNGDDKQQIISGGSDSTIKLWDINF